MALKLALPKGRLLNTTAKVLERAGLGLSGYSSQARLYRLASATFPDLGAKIFHEKDIPIQVAIGNYDLGICGLDWVQELTVKYPRSTLLKIRDLGYGKSNLYLASARGDGLSSVQRLGRDRGTIRLASEYPNLAESLALRLRLGSFKVFPLWGSAEAYPPEDADLAVISAPSPDSLLAWGLQPLDTALSSSAFLIANRHSWENKDLSRVLAALVPGDKSYDEEQAPPGGGWVAGVTASSQGNGTIRLALPDGHQQPPAIELLRQAGIQMEGYSSTPASRRPATGLPGVRAKVIRPQDMPSQVASGNFDVALGGKDWLLDHQYRFPASPVRMLRELNRGKVRLVAVVSEQLPVEDVPGLRGLVQSGRLAPLRVASEYVNIADKYARDNHLSPYRIIPTWGASEAFLPEDADLLIENTETGKTLARHNLRIIDTLMESQSCFMGNASSLSDPVKGELINDLVGKFKVL